MTPFHNSSSLMQEIDRLVDGELSRVERRELLKRLESEPDGWRRCALAFLENQAFREGFKPVTKCVGWVSEAQPTEKPDDAVGYAPPGRPAVLKLPSHRARGRLLTAAAVLLAFTLGWAVKPKPTASPPLVVQNPAPTVPVLPAIQPVVALKPAERTSRPDPDFEQKRALERAGFQVRRLNRYVAVDTSKGRRVAVPVNEYNLQYVGNRTY